MEQHNSKLTITGTELETVDEALSTAMADRKIEKTNSRVVVNKLRDDLEMNESKDLNRLQSILVVRALQYANPLTTDLRERIEEGLKEEYGVEVNA